MRLSDSSDTIAAIASPPGGSARGIVRLSGPSAWALALQGFTPDQEGVATPRRIVGSYRLENLRPALRASVLLGRGPRTYTGQDSAEIHTMGSPPILELLLAHCLKRGARLAGPGEFTLRAFLSGRIDLTQAEAVLAVIDAHSRAQLDAALAQLAGGLAAPIATLRDRLLDVLAQLEAGLDFVDEPDVDELGRRELARSLTESAQDLARLAERLRERIRPEGHPRVVLTGPPNAGKSRLFNALLGRDHALVSPRAGTTRDYLSALCELEGLSALLIDTAGADEAETAMEARAQSFRREQIASADLILECVAADLPPPAMTDRARLQVRTKCDLDLGREHDPDAIRTSAETGEGLDELRRAIARELRARDAEDDLATTTGARSREGLFRASAALASAAETLVLNAGDELIAIDLRQAIDDLGRVIGAVVTDDVLDRIFRRFCIGK